MRKVALLSTLILSTIGLAQAASAQMLPDFSLRGFRLEGNVGGDRFQSQGVHNDKFGYGGTVGFDGQIGQHIVVGPEGSFWRANNGNGNCTGGVNGGTVCARSYDEWGAAVRAGYLFTPNLLLFGKGGWVTNRQHKDFAAPVGETSFTNRFGTDGYQVGGGVEYTLPAMGGFAAPIYLSAQYVYSNYDDHTSRQRLMGGIGIRFK